MERHTTESAAETEAIAAELAAGLRPGDVVLVSGDLGAGKTTFVRGAAHALGVEGPITSPTFTVGHRYAGRVPVSHLDLYRLGSLGDEDPGLLDDYLTADAVSFVEWPEVGTGEIGQVVLRIALGHAGEDRRELEVEWCG